jgi:MFS family permease
LLLAPLVLFTITEPRNTIEGLPRHSRPAPPFREIVDYLWQRRAFRHLCFACALHATAIYGTGAFNASFLIRSHGWETTSIGQLLAILGAFGILGTFIGAIIADRCSMRWNDPRWYLWVCGISTVLMAPFNALSYLTQHIPTLIVAFALCGFLSTAFFGPSFAATQALASPRMRAVTSSILIFIKTMIGMGIGPLLIGSTSDLLSPMLEQHSLRYALLLAVFFNLWSGVHFFLSARYMREDLSAGEEVQTIPQLVT